MNEKFEPICMACRAYKGVPPDFVRTNCGWCEKNKRYVRGLKAPSYYDCKAFERR